MLLLVLLDRGICYFGRVFAGVVAVAVVALMGLVRTGWELGTGTTGMELKMTMMQLESLKSFFFFNNRVTKT